MTSKVVRNAVHFINHFGKEFQQNLFLTAAKQEAHVIEFRTMTAKMIENTNVVNVFASTDNHRVRLYSQLRYEYVQRSRRR